MQPAVVRDIKASLPGMGGDPGFCLRIGVAWPEDNHRGDTASKAREEAWRSRGIGGLGSIDRNDKNAVPVGDLQVIPTENSMKTRSVFHARKPRFVFALVATLAITGSAVAERETKRFNAMKGGEQLQHLNRPEQVKALKEGDTVAMACSMCKNIAVVRVERSRGREFLTPGTRHGCAMCGGTVEITGQRMDKREVIKHTCSRCGEGSTFCCATRRTSRDSSQGESSNQGRSERATEHHPETKPTEPQ